MSLDVQDLHDRAFEDEIKTIRDGSVVDRQLLHHGKEVLPPDEKEAEGKDGFVPSEKEYIPIDLAREQISQLADKMETMRKRHLQVIDQITEEYERVHVKNREQFTSVLDKVKSTAQERLRVHKANIRDLEIEKKKTDALLEKKMSSWTEHKKKIATQMLLLQKERDALLAQKANLDLFLEKKKTKIDELSKEVTDKQATIDGMVDATEQAKKAAVDAEAKRDEAAKSLEGAEKDKAAALAQVSEMEEKMKAQEGQVHADYDEMKDAKEKLSSDLEAMRSEMDTLETEKGALETKLAEAQTAREAVESQLDDSKAQMEKMEVQMQNALAASDSAAGDSHDAKRNAALVAAQLEMYDDRLTALRMENKRLLNQLDTLKGGMQDNIKRVIADMRASAATSGGRSPPPASSSSSEAKSHKEYVDEEYETEEDVEVEVEEEVDVPVEGSGGVDPAVKADYDLKLAEVKEQKTVLAEKTRELDAKLAALEPQVETQHTELKAKFMEHKRSLQDYKSKKSELDSLIEKFRFKSLTRHDPETDTEVAVALDESFRTGLKEFLDLCEANDVMRQKLRPSVEAIKKLKADYDKIRARKTEISSKLEELTAAKPGDDNYDEVKEQVDLLGIEFKQLEEERVPKFEKLTAMNKEFQRERKTYVQRQDQVATEMADTYGFDWMKVDGKKLALSDAHRIDLARMVELMGSSLEARAKVVALKGEVDVVNKGLKKLKASRASMTKERSAVVDEAAALQEPDAPVAAAGASGETRKEKRLVKKIEKKKVTKTRKKEIVVVDSPATAAAAGDGGGVDRERAAQVTAEMESVMKMLDQLGKTDPAIAEIARRPPVPSVAAGAGPADPALKGKVTKLESEKSALQARLSDAERARASEVKALEAQLAANDPSKDADERVKDLGTQLVEVRDQAKKQLADAVSARDRVQAELDAARGETSQLGAQVAELRARIAAGGAGAAAGAAAPPPQDGAGAGAGAAGGADPAEVSSLKEEVSTLNSRIAQMQAAADSSEQPLLTNGDIKELQSKLSQVESDAKQHLDALRGSLTSEFEAKLQAQKQEYEQKIAELTTKIAQLEQLLQERSDQLAAETKVREEKEAALASLQTEFAEVKELNDTAEVRYQALNTEKKAAEDTIVEKDGTITTLTGDLKESKSENKFMKDRLEEEVKRRKEFQFKYEEVKGKVRVYCRVRPFNKKELLDKETKIIRQGSKAWALEIDKKEKDLMGVETSHYHEFSFDAVFQAGINGSQEEVFEETKVFADLSAGGMNTCIFAYGQSGTGKTYTMAGVEGNKGLKPRMVERIYQIKEESIATHEYTISCYMLEVYLNRLEDLFWKAECGRKHGYRKMPHTKAEKERGDPPSKQRLPNKSWPEPPTLKLRSTGNKVKKILVEGAMHKEFKTAEDMIAFTEEAELYRHTRKTGLNEDSSRSHSIFTIVIKQKEKKTKKVFKGKLSLIDLAGSERVEKTSVEGLTPKEREAMVKEGVAINTSLQMLKGVFRVLGQQGQGGKNSKQVVQYRGNTLTEVMEDSLGGRAKTLMFVNIGPTASNVSESMDSLQYGTFVNNIQLGAAVAEVDQSEQVRHLELELEKYQEKFGPLD